ncbi:MAG: outer membrane lipid asymmetry maintenance protein MlaD [candidate division NC10 bacterium]|nr:outer membrane lipid asymmetry maintenance protein MlaD [candidate division NC10 bacterium]
MKRGGLEVVVGVFLLLGIFALGWISIRLGQMQVLGVSGYTVYADFPTAGGLKEGASVEIAGVKIGRVEGISLIDYQARVAMRIDSGVELQEDTIASIKTKGLIGEKYMRLSPGASDEIISPGGKIRETEPPIDLEDLIGNIIFGKF